MCAGPVCSKDYQYSCPRANGTLHCGNFTLSPEVGSNLNLSCRLPWHRLIWSGKNMVLTYHWTKQLSDGSFEHLMASNHSDLLVENLNKTDEGEYRCSLRDQDGNIFSNLSWTVHVLSPTPPPGKDPDNNGTNNDGGGGGGLTPWEIAAIAAGVCSGLLAFAGCVLLIRKWWKNRDKK